MLTQIVLIEQRLLHIRQLRRQLATEDAHIGALFQHDGVMHRVFGILTPGKRAVGMHQHAGHLRRVDSLLTESFDNHVAGFPLIFAVDLRIGHQPGAGNRAIEIVSVGGAGRWNGLPGLRPDGGVARMGMHNTAQRREGLIQQAMSRGIRRGLLVAFHHLASLQTDHHHIVGGHHAVIHAGGFDNQNALVAVDGADVAPG